MKSCPTCNRTFEDTFTFCLADGSLLNAPFDPQATLVIPEPRQTEPPPTEVSQPKKVIEEEIPPTVASPQPEQKPEELVSTIAAPAPKVELPPYAPAQASHKSSRSPLIMVGVGALLIIGLIYFITTNRTGRTTENSNKANAATTNTALPALATSSNSSQVSSTATPSPLPSLTPVSNLEGTVWDVARVQEDYPEHTYKSTLEFKPNGKITEPGDLPYEGVWTQRGNKVSIKAAYEGKYNPFIMEGTINGNEMSGNYNFIELRTGKGTFTAHRVK
jgi:hypothetical protein